MRQSVDFTPHLHSPPSHPARRSGMQIISRRQGLPSGPIHQQQHQRKGQRPCWRGPLLRRYGRQRQRAGVRGQGRPSASACAEGNGFRWVMPALAKSAEAEGRTQAKQLCQCVSMTAVGQEPPFPRYEAKVSSSARAAI